MPYLGKTPSQGVRARYQFTPNAGATSVSGADANGSTMTFTDGNYVDVYLNGVMLKAGTDYNTNTANTIASLAATVASDVVDVIVYDTFSLFGGTLEGNVTVSNGTLTANTGVNIDNISIDGTTIALSSGDLTLDAAGDIKLNADGGEILLEDASVTYGQLKNSSSDFIIQSLVNDKDIIFRGNDNNGVVTALTLDMSDAGAATFNSSANFGGAIAVGGSTVTDSNMLNIQGNGSSVNVGAVFNKTNSTAQIWSTQVRNSDNAFLIHNYTASSTPLVISTAGNVGIGGAPNAYSGYTSLTLNHATNGGILDFEKDGNLVGELFLPDVNTFAVTAVGAKALSLRTNSAERFKIASDGSLSTPTAGANNVRLGENAGNSITSGGNFNTLVGDEAGTALTTGDNNVAIGFQALDLEDEHGTNVAIGRSSLSRLNAGVDAYNTAVGHLAGDLMTTGIQNTLIGGAAGDALTDADYNTAVGAFALSADTLGTRSTAIGYATLNAQNFTSATSTHNTAVGFECGKSVTTGINNTLMGSGTGDALTTGSYNTAIGGFALTADDVGGQTTAIGWGALQSQNFASATNSLNTAVGYNAGAAVTTGTLNTLMGANTGDALTIGIDNVVIGRSALTTDTAGKFTVAVGSSALENQNFSSATNAYNVAVGHEAGKAVTTGQSNTFIGALAGDGTDDGDENTAVGMSALTSNCGDNNTAVGHSSLVACTGSSNTAFGHDAGAQITSGSNLNAFGKDSSLTGSPGGAATTGSNAIYLGDENITAAYIQVDWTVTSDERDKTDFTDLDIGLDFVKAMKPYTFKWDQRSKYGDKTADDYDLNSITADGTHKEDWLDLGFKAQDIKALEEASNYKIADKTNLTVSITDDGKQYGMKYAKLVPILVKAIQELEARVKALEE